MQTLTLFKASILAISFGALSVACSAGDPDIALSEAELSSETIIGSAGEGGGAPVESPEEPEDDLHSCGIGTEFCNSSCGICILPNAKCVKDTCPANGRGLKKCGNSYCGKGTECVADQCVPAKPAPNPKLSCGAGTEFCNSSCGICIPTGAKCSIDTCKNNGSEEQRCGLTWCAPGTYCKSGVCYAKPK